MANFSSILDDSSRLNNFKSRHGLKINNSNSVSLFTSQSKLRKYLAQELEGIFKYKFDKDQLIDKIVDRCDDQEIINAVKSYFDSCPKQEFVDVAQGKVRVFFKEARKFTE